MRNRVEVMHGVNLDQLGRRDPEHYGTLTLDQLELRIRRWRSTSVSRPASSTPTTRASSSSTCIGWRGHGRRDHAQPGRVDALLLRDPRCARADRPARGRGPPVRRRAREAWRRHSVIAELCVARRRARGPTDTVKRSSACARRWRNRTRRRDYTRRRCVGPSSAALRSGRCIRAICSVGRSRRPSPATCTRSRARSPTLVREHQARARRADPRRTRAAGRSSGSRRSSARSSASAWPSCCTPTQSRASTPIPPEGAIDEAVETAKRFCGADAPGFVNGILGAVLRELQAQRKT